MSKLEEALYVINPSINKVARAISEEVDGVSYDLLTPTDQAKLRGFARRMIEATGPVPPDGRNENDGRIH